MADNDEKLQQFMTVTGVDEERARFYMESSAGQLEVALASFYENDGEADGPEIRELESSRSDSEEPGGNNTNKPKPKQKNTRFATVHTLSNSSDDEEEGQAFYAGGSEHSGQQVLGPPKKDIVADMFKSVREHGVEILDSGPSSSGRQVFGGTGYKLGQCENDSEVIPGRNAPSPPVQVTLKLWRDGFSLNNSELRLYTDPANKDFLESVRRGEIPQELRQGSSEVHLSMEDHRMEGFKKDDRKSRTAFSGQGHTLGSPAPATVGAPLEEDRTVNEANARQLVSVNPSQPTTNLQIRLADGSRLLGQFNHEHTVAQVRSYIIAARPQYETRPFTLLSAFPSRELQDGQTIADAGILNSAIMQKLK